MSILHSCIFYLFLFLDKEYLMIVIQDPSRPWGKAFVPLCDCKYKIHLLLVHCFEVGFWWNLHVLLFNQKHLCYFVA